MQNQEFIRARWGKWGLWNFHKHLVKKKEKEGKKYIKYSTEGNILELFLLDTIKTAFLLENLIQ